MKLPPATFNLTVDSAEIDLVADVLLWEMWRSGDWDAEVIAEARKVAAVIVDAQRRGEYRHRIIAPPSVGPVSEDRS